MKCPRCGADNSDRAERCYLCEQPFVTVSMEGISTDAQEPSRPQHPQPAQAPGYQPHPGETLGQQRPMPAGFPPGYGQSAPGKRYSSMKVLVVILVVLVLVSASGALIYLAFSGSTSIVVPTPPGWEPADEDIMSEFEKASDQGGSEVRIDYLFSDSTLTNSIAVGHGNAYIMDSPEGEDLESIEEFFTRHKSEIVGQLEAASLGFGINIVVQKYAVEEMACGVPALFVDMVLSGQGLSMTQGYMFCFKDDTMFFSVITKDGRSGSQEESDFLKENISFK